MQEWASALYALGGAIIGALGAMGAQWLSVKHTERIEHARWDLEKAKEVRQTIRSFRKERARPVLDALDRASAVYSVDWGLLEELMQVTGYYGEKVDPEQKAAREEERRKRSKERLDMAVDDISTVARISNPAVREILLKALWKGIERPETQHEEHLRPIDEAYLELEKWMFNVPDRE